jgi:16S rRNA A1518/A1519 N6-dimethyltransferase RsmA/KsgA/DIM1 with predicted DNA glycosylase/AP lyase activity
MTEAQFDQQHDLSPAAARSFVATAGVRKRDAVFEVGAGLGELTAAILHTGANVHAVERDHARLKRLRDRFETQIKEGQLTVHAADARFFTPILPEGWRVVANPPFNLTAELLRRWLLGDFPGGPPRALDLVLQFQTAQKITGIPQRTRTSVLVNLVGSALICKRLRRDDVHPPSRVDLSGWTLRRGEDAPAPEEMRDVDLVLEHAFAGPRTMAEALRGLATSTQIKRQSREQGWNPLQHPREVQPEAWRSLAKLLRSCQQLP